MVLEPCAPTASIRRRKPAVKSSFYSGAMRTFRCKTCYNRPQRLSITKAVLMSGPLWGDSALLHQPIDVLWTAYHLSIRNSSKVESGQYHAETSMLVVAISGGAASLTSRGA
jgi:hypothetical protein